MLNLCMYVVVAASPIAVIRQPLVDCGGCSRAVFNTAETSMPFFDDSTNINAEANNSTAAFDLRSRQAKVELELGAMSAARLVASDSFAVGFVCFFILLVLVVVVVFIIFSVFLNVFFPLVFYIYNLNVLIAQKWFRSAPPEEHVQPITRFTEPILASSINSNVLGDNPSLYFGLFGPATYEKDERKREVLLRQALCAWVEVIIGDEKHLIALESDRLLVPDVWEFAMLSYSRADGFILQQGSHKITAISTNFFPEALAKLEEVENHDVRVSVDWTAPFVLGYVPSANDLFYTGDIGPIWFFDDTTGLDDFSFGLALRSPPPVPRFFREPLRDVPTRPPIFSTGFNSVRSAAISSELESEWLARLTDDDVINSAVANILHLNATDPWSVFEPDVLLVEFSRPPAIFRVQDLILACRGTRKTTNLSSGALWIKTSEYRSTLFVQDAGAGSEWFAAHVELSPICMSGTCRFTMHRNATGAIICRHFLGVQTLTFLEQLRDEVVYEAPPRTTTTTTTIMSQSIDVVLFHGHID